MSGTANLATLLATMEPELSDIEVVFCSLPDITATDLPALAPIGLFQEREGTTLILRKSAAEQAGLRFDMVLREITLTVHSSLQAVGFTAAIAARLALHGISANCVAAYYHDHFFVSAADAPRALQVLHDLQAEASAGCCTVSDGRA